MPKKDGENKHEISIKNHPIKKKTIDFSTSIVLIK